MDGAIIPDRCVICDRFSSVLARPPVDSGGGAPGGQSGRGCRAPLEAGINRFVRCREKQSCRWVKKSHSSTNRRPRAIPIVAGEFYRLKSIRSNPLKLRSSDICMCILALGEVWGKRRESWAGTWRNSDDISLCFGAYFIGGSQREDR